jgi:hypothetical protein
MPHETQEGAGAPPLTTNDRLHILGRAAMALAVGWGYLLLIFAFDVAGLRSWAWASPIGAMATTQLFGITGVAFGAVGAHVGWTNVGGEAARRRIAAAAARRGSARHMGLKP